MRRREYPLIALMLALPAFMFQHYQATHRPAPGPALAAVQPRLYGDPLEPPISRPIYRLAPVQVRDAFHPATRPAPASPRPRAHVVARALKDPFHRSDARPGQLALVLSGIQPGTRTDVGWPTLSRQLKGRNPFARHRHPQLEPALAAQGGIAPGSRTDAGWDVIATNLKNKDPFSVSDARQRS